MMLLGRNFEPKLPSMLEGAACLKEQTEERCCSLKSGFKKKVTFGGFKKRIMVCSDSTKPVSENT